MSTSLTLILLKDKSRRGVRKGDKVVVIGGQRYRVELSNNLRPLPSDERLEIYVRGAIQLYDVLSPRMNVTIPDISQPEGQAELSDSPSESPDPEVQEKRAEPLNLAESPKSSYDEMMSVELSERVTRGFIAQIPWEENPFRDDEATTGEGYTERYNEELSGTVAPEDLERMAEEEDPFKKEEERNEEWRKVTGGDLPYDSIPFGTPSVVL
ncbi:MAG: hypothetical protein PHH00_01075 [Candidatus Nanoarchaeia archaeon]|nr:hypothetical protein [Candidatus Nanoarchaeia archaeon]